MNDEYEKAYEAGAVGAGHHARAGAVVTLTKHDREVVKNAVRSMRIGYGQVYQWAGDGFQEHWADSIALGIATARDSEFSGQWLFELKMAVWEELGLSNNPGAPTERPVLP